MQAIARPAPEAQQKGPRKISWQEFKGRYLSREDGFKYEWVDGLPVKTTHSMDQSQAFILSNLLDFFIDLRAKTGLKGMLLPETDSFYLENHRRPDIIFLTSEQIKASRAGQNSVPSFTAEVISKNDQLGRAAEKLEDYRRAGVEVVWHIYPHRKEVHIFRGKHMTICTDDDPCSAEPAIPGFVLPASAIFA